MDAKMIRLITMCLAVILLAGCSVKVNVTKKDPSAEELLANQELIADPVQYNSEGAYSIEFHYNQGGFEKMDLSKAYVAYYPFTAQNQIDTIVGEDTEDIPPLPTVGQDAINEAMGAEQLVKVAVITIETIDDKTVTVSFTDKDNPVSGKEYFFIIPNEGLSGSVLPE